MNPFMVLVERAVRPVQAGPKRKLRMREELLAHLMSVYEEELARLGDADAARAEAVRRFGDPVSLTPDLQAALRFSDRLDARLDRAFGWRPGESAVRYSARTAGLVALVILPWAFFGLGVAEVKRPHDGSVPTTGMLLRFFAGVLVFAPATVFLMALLSIRIRDSLHGAFGAPRSWRKVVGNGVLSLFVFPVLGPVFFWVSFGHLDVLSSSLATANLVSSAVGYLLVPVYLVWFAWKLGPAQIRHVEWASLDIGQ